MSGQSTQSMRMNGRSLFAVGVAAASIVALVLTTGSAATALKSSTVQSSAIENVATPLVGLPKGLTVKALASVVGPADDSWTFSVASSTLECQASSSTLRKNPWLPTYNGYCGTFVSVDNVMYGMGVRNYAWQRGVQVPIPYSAVTTSWSGIGVKHVVMAGATGVQITQDSRYNASADGWFSTVTVLNTSSETHSVDAQIIAGACAPWGAHNVVERLFDPETHRASCRNDLNVVTFEPPQPGVDWYNGTSNVWGQGKKAELGFRESLSFTTEIKWRKDGAVPAGEQPLPEWYGPSMVQSFGGGSPDVNTTQCDCADPVNSATGEYWQTASDLSLPGRSPLGISRTYSSLGGSGGVFGPGWSSLVDSHVVAGSSLLVVHANGSATEFGLAADGHYAADPDVRASLTRDPATGEYTYRLRNAESSVFDSAGRLRAIVDKNGEATTITRSLSSIVFTTPDGRTATYHLDAQGRAVDLFGPDSRTTRYTYDGAGRLATVSDSRGSVWRYGYNDDGRMVQDTAPISGTISTTYDDDGRVATQTNRRGGLTTLAYATSGTTSTTSVTDPAGVTTDYVYDHGLLIRKVVDPGGEPAVWDYTYDLAGNQLTATTPTGERVWQSFDDKGRLVRRIDEAGAATTYTYGDLDVPLSESDTLGTTTFTYDAHGNLLTEARPRGGVDATTTVSRAAAHPADVVSVTDPDGRVTSYASDAAGFVSSRTAPGGGVTTWTRNAYGQILTEVSPRGNATGAVASDYKTTYVYDSAGALASISDPLGHHRTYGLDSEGRVTSVTNANGLTSSVEYLADGNIGSATDPAGHVTRYTLDLAGKNVATTEADGAVTTTEYDSHGWPSEVTSPSGNAADADADVRAAFTTTYSRDLSGRVTEVSNLDPDNAGRTLVSATSYDTAGRVGSVTDPAGNVTEYEYRVGDLLSGVYEPTGGFVSYEYDEHGDVVAFTDELRSSTKTTYSPGGAILSVANAAGESTRLTYDAAGRLASVVDPRGTCSGCTASNYTTSYGYDLDGNPTTVTDQLGQATTSQYDRAARLVSVKDANNHTTAYTYDSDDNLLTTTSPDGGVTTVAYDNAGNVATLATPRGTTYNYAYDPTGRVLSVTDPLGRANRATYTPEGLVATLVTARGATTSDPADGTIRYDYDSLGRLIDTAFSDGTDPVHYSYDANSNLSAVQDAAGQEARQYDSMGRLTTLVRNDQTWTYTYDVAGNLSTVTRPDGSNEAWTYDAVGRAKSMTTAQGKTSYNYDRASNLTQTSAPNGTSESQTWDRRGDVASITTKRASTTLVSQTITRDNIGNPTQIVTNRGGKSETRSYLYDSVDRLQAICYVAKASCTGAPAATQYWTYDKNGNRLTEKNGTAAGTTTNYTYDVADQLTTSKLGTASAVGYTYDADGNMLSNGQTSWSYGLDNRVRSATTGSTTATFTRDAAGRVVAVASPAGTVQYQWDLGGTVPVLAASTAAGTVTSYRYDPLGRLAAITASGTTVTVGHDAIGTATDMVATTGALVRSYDYTPFGVARAAVGAPATPSGPTSAVSYGGLLVTADASTLTAPNRSYLTGLGRWTGVDPVGAPTGDNYTTPYAYVSNAPTRYVDPLGSFNCDVNSDACAVGTFAWNMNLGAEAALESAILSFANPVGTAGQAISACVESYKSYSARWSVPGGLMGCKNANDPVLHIAEQLQETFTSQCMEESGKAFGGAWFNATLLVATAKIASGAGRALGTSSDASLAAEAAGQAPALTISQKIAGQMGPRGWSQGLMDETVANPAATHPVWDFTTGTKQAATAYARSDGSYVVVNDSTRAVVQVSDINNTGWKPVWDDPRFQR